MSDKKPTVGRIVHFVGLTCQAAIVTDAHEDTQAVDLAVFASGGTVYETDVWRDDGEVEAYQLHTWHWPERSD